jgi:hypothetical protein
MQPNARLEYNAEVERQTFKIINEKQQNAQTIYLLNL